MQGVQIATRRELAAHVAVDLAWRHGAGVAAADHDGLLGPGGWRLVAFERDADQVFTQAECVHDLSRRGQQRNNSHACHLTTVPANYAWPG